MKKNKKEKKKVIVATCFDKDEEKEYREVWDEIIKAEIEKKYGKIKIFNI